MLEGSVVRWDRKFCPFVPSFASRVASNHFTFCDLRFFLLLSELCSVRGDKLDNSEKQKEKTGTRKKRLEKEKEKKKQEGKEEAGRRQVKEIFIYPPCRTRVFLLASFR